MAVSPQTNCTLAEVANRMHELDDFVVCGHVSPDGDCLGSQLALAAALRRLGKRVSCVLVKDEPVEANLLRVLDGAQDLVFAGAYKGAPGAFVGVDVPTRERIGEAACALLDQAPFSFTIDHHAVDTTMCDMVYVDPDAASTTMLIWELAGYLGVERTGAVANCCYTGLVTDTGRFQYQNTDERCMSLWLLRWRRGRRSSKRVARGVPEPHVRLYASLRQRYGVPSSAKMEQLLLAT